MSMTATETAKTNAEQIKRHFLDDRQAVTECVEQLAPLKARLDAEIASLQKQFQEQNAELIATQQAFEESAVGYELQLRELAVAHFNNTGDKTLDENLSVRVNTKFEYETEKAVEWAKTNAPVLIVQTVDKKGFESLPSTPGLDFVHKIDTVTAVIKGLK